MELPTIVQANPEVITLARLALEKYGTIPDDKMDTIFLVLNAYASPKLIVSEDQIPGHDFQAFSDLYNNKHISIIVKPD